QLPNTGPELWVGNPPYNGTSDVLRDPPTYERLRALLPDALPPGQSLRDDFAFFLLRVAARFQERDGLLTFVTPTSLIDGYLYTPIRRALLCQLDLLEVLELGRGVFRDTRVQTCVTVWRSRRGASVTQVCYRTRSVRGPFAPDQ